MDLKKIKEYFRNLQSYRWRQAQKAIFVNLVEDWQAATELPGDLRNDLNLKFNLGIRAEKIESNQDKSVKAVITLEDGLRVETVLLKHADGRRTVCLSCQVGCPLGCHFCATGEMGHERNLNADEIIIQALFFARLLKKENQNITNLVFMGMGEPFLNYENVIAAIKIFNNSNNFNIGARHISISTVGIPEGIRKLADESEQVNLAVSLHAPNNRLRSKLIPINNSYQIEKVLAAVKFYLGKTNRQVMFEYLLIKNQNDAPELAQELSRLLSGIPKKLYVVNLIVYNQTSKYFPSDEEDIKKFKDVLEQKRIKVTLRHKFGNDITAACGQLAQKTKKC